MLTGSEARQVEPALGLAVAAGVLFPHEAQCDPVRLTRSVGAAAVEAGATLRRGVEAYRLRADPGGVTVETTGGTLRAGHVVVAAGAWSGGLAADTRHPASAPGRQGLRR